jgi:hypothetical protein
MSRHHVDHVAVFDLIRKCTPRQASNLSNSSSIQTRNAAKKADKVHGNGNKNYSSISLQITAVFVWQTKGWKNEETGNNSALHANCLSAPQYTRQVTVNKV